MILDCAPGGKVVINCAAMTSADFIELINAQLPQTQCTKCGFDGCRPYAEAIAAGELINRCPPGGPQTIERLAAVTGQSVRPLNPEVGQHVPQQLAVIREDECIGCTKCIQACPVDAIVGAAKLMHTVIADECTGCDLCLEPCPVDCIDLITVGTRIEPPSRETATHWRQRYERREARLARDAEAADQRRLLKLKDKLAALDRGEELQRDSVANTALAKTPEQLRAEIMAAVARKKANKP
ncbi:RnfABCDGE type electron transport complex subunit B [Pseudohongiella spirulinae]|uniref:Electron transport complex subunit B n=1 Tax=Pseudohongiella spirulinae TaxID=1249552 RepID=A0A0S2KDG5_9GAMM|nr:RnfABCDGE type electron transport complex subunit B [Pseudohongiella spirulinae]ALO46352.1 Electron transport complex subunit B [Pseudohongiella spirulinae]